MDGTLIFCKDGILRFRSHYDDVTAIPLLAIQDSLQEDDHSFLLQYFRHNVVIEDGTTLSHVFLAIEPWAKTLGIYLDMDVMAYIDEIRKPSQAEPLFDWIGIQKVTSIHHAYQHQEMRPGESFTAHFNRERIPTRRFDIEVACTANGYKHGDKESYSISGDIHTIKNVPIIFSDRQVLASYGFEKNNLVDAHYPGVFVNNKIRYIQGTVVFLLYEIVDAIFKDGLFYISPQVATYNLEIIKKITEKLESEDVDNQRMMDEQDSESRQKNQDDKKITMEMAEGAFDPMIEHMQAELKNWLYIKSLCDSNSELPIRIGNVIEAKVPDYRFLNFIIDDSD
ncbi:hypothetical protein SJI19_19765 [Acerihabitans sp. TG2]|uniref:hypothetical protein n=1 Tax=Acerihabitans sp. TG2 TaxID=3096008 RepID=UPI002B230037|nr:hypothetical protein [Acerihabitans sp. TG2]MEA9392743.1 hypothetical protein [Acerihabitans sp. TG2]